MHAPRKFVAGMGVNNLIVVETENGQLIYTRKQSQDAGTLVVFLFFFKAEDGIRDVAVTGVQTCALPISATVAWRPCPARAVGGRPGLAPAAGAPRRLAASRPHAAGRSVGSAGAPPA